MVAIIILCAIFGSFALNFSGAQVVSFLSDNQIVSVIELLALYVLKTCSIMFPLGALQIASGMIYPLPVALLVNLAGLMIIVTIPFALGKKTTPELQRKLIQRFPKLQRVENFQNRTPFTYCFLLRVVCVVPRRPAQLVSGYHRSGIYPLCAGDGAGEANRYDSLHFVGSESDGWGRLAVLVPLGAAAASEFPGSKGD